MSANSSSRGEDALRLFSVRGSPSSPGAMEQNPRYFHSSWEQHTHAIKHGMKRIIRGAQRWIHARKHLPCLIGSVTFSGLSRLLHLPDMMGREGSEEEGQRYKQTEIKKKVLLITLNKNSPSVCSRPENPNAINSHVKTGFQISTNTDRLMLHSPLCCSEKITFLFQLFLLCRTP